MDNKITDLQLDSIPTHLKDNKEKIINMGLTLDRYEISKSLTISLNRMLMGINTNLVDVYDFIMDNFDNVSNKIKLIEDKIKYFNLVSQSVTILYLWLSYRTTNQPEIRPPVIIIVVIGCTVNS